MVGTNAGLARATLKEARFGYYCAFLDHGSALLARNVRNIYGISFFLLGAKVLFLLHT